MRTPRTVSPRVPAPWQSARGEAGPKARPQRRSRRTAGRDSGPAPRALSPERTPERSTGGHVDRPSNRVGVSTTPRRECERRASAPTERCGVDGREKSWGEHASARTVNRHRWARRAASGERVKRGQGTRHNGPVTSEEGMLHGVLGLAPSARRSRRESAQATV